MTKKPGLTKIGKQETGQSLKRLVQMFSDISHIEKAKNDITAYVKVNSSITNRILKTGFFFARNKEIILDCRILLLRTLQLGIENRKLMKKFFF